MEFVSFTSPSPTEPEENHEVSVPINIGKNIGIQQVSGKMLNVSNLHSSSATSVASYSLYKIYPLKTFVSHQEVTVETFSRITTPSHLHTHKTLMKYSVCARMSLH